MSKHFSEQINRLKDMILSMAELVEGNVCDAVRALEEGDTDLALEVIFNDTRIDQKDIEIGEECLHTFALYQPVASDMRTVASILTINKDLERIGDLSVNLAEQAILLAKEAVSGDVPFALMEEGERVVSMVNRSLKALVEQDSGLARRVLDEDDEVDQIHRQMYKQVKHGVAAHPEQASGLIDLLVASRNLERIADHAVNIAEDVIYMVEGELVRHNHLNDRDRARIRVPLA